MKKIALIITVILVVVLAGCNSNTAKKKIPLSNKVELKQNNGKYRLYVNGQEFYVKGAGLEFGDINRLAANGGNSFRTWRTDNGKQTAVEVLNEAQKHNLMVLMGIEVGRERHGYDYNDSVWVNKQKEDIRQQVLQIKDHPALLGWAIGNELNLRATNKKVWQAVNDISIMIHQIDGNHPTTTTFAGFSPENAADYMKYCTDLDFVSIQMYGDIYNLQKHIAVSGYKGPYMVTEWGATGHWEVPKTEWGIAIEQTSSEKAASVLERWNKAIAADQKLCLGSYVFLWGQKQERTPTWYGLFTEAGEEIQVIDVMYEVWNGKKPENLAPTMDSVFLNGMARNDNVYLKPDQTNKFTFSASDPNNDSLKMRIEIIPDMPDKYQDGGDKEHRPKPILKTELMDYSPAFEFKTPQQNGPYRVFVYVSDGNGKVATANVPFFVGTFTSLN